MFFKEKNRQDRVCDQSAEDVSIDALLKGIKNLKDSANMLEQMLFRQDLASFFKEAKNRALSDARLAQFEQEYMNGNTSFDFIGRVRTWLNNKGV